MIDDKELQAIEARTEAATEGPWECRPCELLGTWDVGSRSVNPYWPWQETPVRARSRVDQVFIAHAREDIPALVSEVRKLRDASQHASSMLTDALFELDELNNPHEAKEKILIAQRALSPLKVP